MKKNQFQPLGAFAQYSITCVCEVDRLIQDDKGHFFCGECMEPLERIEARELPKHIQEEILMKLELRKRIDAEDAAMRLHEEEDEDDED